MNKHVSQSLSRRDAITLISSMMGCAFIGNVVRADEASAVSKNQIQFSGDELLLLDEIGETIIPQTDTPGAKAANIGAFMAMMVNGCYDSSQQRIFKFGLARIDELCILNYQKTFVDSTATQRFELLNKLDREQQLEHNADEGAPHYFRMMKQLTLLGFFTSEIGATQVLNYVEVPGRYDGNALYKKGDRAWYVPPTAKLADR